MKCEYLIWNKKTKELKQCGKEIATVLVDKDKNVKEVPLIVPDIKKIRDMVSHDTLFLCDEHKEFVKDCLMGEYHVKSVKALLKRERLSGKTKK